MKTFKRYLVDDETDKIARQDSLSASFSIAQYSAPLVISHDEDEVMIRQFERYVIIDKKDWAQIVQFVKGEIK